MPRPKQNPYPEGSGEWVNREAELEVKRMKQKDRPSERNLTITVSLEAINAAKSLATLSGSTYREVLAVSATNGVEALTSRVRAALQHVDSDTLPD